MIQNDILQKLQERCLHGKEGVVTTSLSSRNAPALFLGKSKAMK